jgi:hypothetical protein
MQATRQLLMEHFDEDVHDRLRGNIQGTQAKLDRIGRLFWGITKHVLAEQAKFNDQELTFELHQSPIATVATGNYSLISKTKENPEGEKLYRLGHPLGEYVLQQAQHCDCPLAMVTFEMTNHPTRIAVVEQLIGQSGWLKLQACSIDSFAQQDYLLFSAVTDGGRNLDQDTCERLFNCGGQVSPLEVIPDDLQARLIADSDRHLQATIAANLEKNNRHFAEARDQLDKWAEDMEVMVQKELDDTKRRIRELQRNSRQAPTLEGQKIVQAEIQGLEKKKRNLRQRIFEVEDEIAEKRDRLVEQLEQRMKQRVKVQDLFTIRWQVI